MVGKDGKNKSNSGGLLEQYMAITAGVLAGVSDSVAQKLSGFEKLQMKRLLLKMLFGFSYAGPLGHYLHKFMDIIFKGRANNKTVAKKVLLEQLTSSPLTHFLFMVYYGWIVEGRPWPQVRNNIKKNYPSVQATAWMFWPVVGWVNYQYIPLQFRVIFHSLVACCWGIFLNLRVRTPVINQLAK
ncbi:Peroxisomal membrane 22 kDa (Mpv17/PMP22) family protein [Zostera marina]|uniref:Peroxisomal membrane 22 kDa (Mpv17/PMP22) family protein n=1 Tax=Zostera marina TaxID=29655 RepID=A0A0K9NZ34_ZOSMR|nr:Peroxisomal membrane 22 kDa (Mpv17/PMP22) family protein [Zostera marina]